MDMFGGLTKTSSRIAIAAALGMTLGGFAMSASPAKAADLGGDCCADLEERVAELEATTVRKGNKKVSVTLSGWVVKLGSWWDDGHETNFYIGDKDTTLSSHFQISGSATIAPGWSGGYTIAVEVPATSCSVGFVENQFNDNACANGNINTLLSYMWLKSDKYGTVNWGQLSQATDNVALLPDLSGTVIESNAVVFDGGGMFVRVKNAKNSNDLASEFKWGGVLTCNTNGGGLGADCNGYPQNAVRYDSPTFGGFSMSTSYGEDDMWDIAVKYAADWNSIKVSAAAGWTQLTDEGCSAPGIPHGGATCSNNAVAGGGGTPFQNYRQDGQLFQVGASILHVPSGLFAYGLYQNDQEEGTQYKNFNFKTGRVTGDANANESDTWFVKAGIKKAWTPLGATVIWGEWGQYNDMYRGLCGAPPSSLFQNPTFCVASLPVGVVNSGKFKGDAITAGALVTGSEVQRWGIGVVQEIDSAAMHLFARWQHLDLDLDAVSFGNAGIPDGRNLTTSWEGLDIFQIGGVIFF
jgi:predicted porin